MLQAVKSFSAVFPLKTYLLWRQGCHKSWKSYGILPLSREKPPIVSEGTILRKRDCFNLILIPCKDEQIQLENLDQQVSVYILPNFFS